MYVLLQDYTTSDEHGDTHNAGLKRETIHVHAHFTSIAMNWGC